LIPYLIPDPIDLANLAAVWAAGLLLFLWGRALLLGRGTPELQTLAGWGGFVVVLTVWGVLRRGPLWWPVPAIEAVALLTLAVPRLRPRRADWVALLRITVLALPLWLIMLTARPSQPDTFLNLLPNAAYLHDYAMLPTDAGPPSHSYLPGAPYDLQLWAYLAGLALPELPASAMAHINVLLHLLFGLLLARVVQFSGREDTVAPSWGATAFGLLIAIGLNPGFVPRIYFSSYSEASVAVSLGAAGWLAARSLGGVAADERPWHDLGALALVLAALVNVKQEAIAFVAALALGVGVLALAGRRGTRLRALAFHVPVFLPAAALYLIWRWFVLVSFQEGELKLRPLDQWRWDALPQVFHRIGEIVMGKGVFFALLALAVVLLAHRLMRRGLDQSTRLLALLVAVVLGYNTFLLFTYVAHFSPEMSADAHSFFRYSTHLSLLLVIALTTLARNVISEQGGIPGPSRRRIAAAAAVLTVTLAPVLFVKRLRFDLVMPQPLVRALGTDTAERLQPGDHLALVLPGDNGSVAAMLESVLRYEAPRWPTLQLSIRDGFDGTTLADLASAGATKALITCTPEGVEGLPAGQPVLLQWQDDRWRILQAWRYPPWDGARWSPILAAKPLCR
jgi:hypothetical protein